MPINDWMQGDGTDCLAGTTAANLIDNNIVNYIQDPLNLILHNYIKGATFRIASSSTITVSAGEVVCTNSAGDQLRMRRNAGTITGDINTDGDGTEDTSTNGARNYVFATAPDSPSTPGEFEIVFSGNTTPTGVTHYKYLGWVEYGASDTNFTYKGLANQVGFLPGMVQMWGGNITSLPDGWLFCNGDAVSRSTYPELFDAIGEQYGNGDGSTTFNLPDMRNYFPVGANVDTADVATASANGSGTEAKTRSNNNRFRLIEEGVNAGGNSACDTVQLNGVSASTSTADAASYPNYVAFAFIIKT